VPEGTIDLEHFYLETHVLEPLENPFGTKVLPNVSGWTEGGWCAQGDDLRTFLNEFVADLTQFEHPAHLRIPIGAISNLGGST
jgi:hypothetical protein